VEFVSMGSMADTGTDEFEEQLKKHSKFYVVRIFYGVFLSFVYFSLIFVTD